MREGLAAEASLIEQELEERALRGEYIPAIAQLMIAVVRPDTAAVRRALRTCYEDRTSWFTVALALGPALDTLLGDSEVGLLVRAMRDGRDAPRSAAVGDDVSR